MGDDADDRFARPGGQEVDRRLQQADVAAEFVDDDAFDEVALVGLEQLEGADDGGQRPAAVDVGDEQHGGGGKLGDAHVDDVVGLEVDFGRTAGPFDDDDVVGGLEGAQRFLDDAEEFAAVAGVVLAGRHVADRAAEDDDLGGGVAGGFEEDWVHVDGRLDAGGFGLGDLGPPHLAAAFGDVGVEGHVLGFEGGDAMAVLTEDPAEGGGEDGFADMGACALEHDGF